MNNTRKVFLDANLFMEIMFARSKLEKVSKLIHDAKSELHMSALSVHILYYFAEMEGIDREFVRKLVDLAIHLPINAAAIELAQKRYDGQDFEDCLQAACAEAGNCQEILTLDKDFKRHSHTNLKVTVV